MSHAPKQASAPEFVFAMQCEADKLHVEREYRFDAVRKFRFDFAIPEHKLGIEIDGGIFGKGGHSTPLGIVRDMTKQNCAVMNGWWVLRFTPADISCGIAINLVKDWLKARAHVERVRA